MYEEIIELLSSVRPDLDFAKEDKLISEEKLDSFDVISVLALLSEKYSVEIDPEMISEEHFDSARKISLLIARLTN